MAKQSKADRELSQNIQRLTEGVTEELKTMLPTIDLRPILSDRKIKQALLEIDPEAIQRLYGEFGIQRVTEFISEFSEGREW